MALVTASGPGGVTIRRLLPVFIVLPLLLGWLRLAGERAGVFDAPMGTGMMMLLFIIVFSAVTYRAGRGANHSAQVLRGMRHAWLWPPAERGSACTSGTSPRAGLFGPNRSSGSWACAPTTTFSPGYSYSDWAHCVHADDLPRIEAELRRCLTEPAPYEAEYRVVWLDGSVHWIADRGVLQYGSDGRATSMLGILMDITERKQAEEAVSRSQKTFSELVERSPFGIYIVDSQFRIAHDERLLARRSVPQRAARDRARFCRGDAHPLARTRRRGNHRPLPPHARHRRALLLAALPQPAPRRGNR